LGEIDDALDCAQKIKKINPKSFGSLEAEFLVLELSKEIPDRVSKLRLLEKRARKQGAVTTANSILLLLGDEAIDTPENIKKNLDIVVRSSRKEADFYMTVRGVIRIGEFSKKYATLLTHSEKNWLIDSYHYLYNQRLNRLFDRCHQAIWEMFEAAGDLANLLRLFRHSSLMWRLRQEEQTELLYVRALELQLKVNSTVLVGIDKEMAYFLTRSDLTPELLSLSKEAI
jgi:hypothetical protein